MPSYALSLLGLCAFVAVAGVKLMDREADAPAPPQAAPRMAVEPEASPPLTQTAPSPAPVAPTAAPPVAPPPNLPSSPGPVLIVEEPLPMPELLPPKH